ncbi:MAG: hypothetical protein ACI8QD_000882 [Cyclobacteriaceae bacterium]|jgi:hypothetical protein
MDPFEYVVVITSLITGLGIAQLLTGTADIISHYKSVKVSYPLLLMIASTFLNHYQEWFYNFQYDGLITGWTMKVVLGLVVYPITLFILARMLFPTGLRSNESDLDAYYFDQWRALFTVNILVILISFFQDMVLSGISPIDQIPKFALIGTHLVFLGFNITNKAAHLVFQLLFFIGMIVFILATDAELGRYATGG